MSTIIPAKDIGALLYNELKSAIKSTMPNASDYELNQAEYSLLVALSHSMFK